jgi:hypothetical protein
MLYDLVKKVNGIQKHAGGRPTKRTPDRAALLIAAIAKGLPYKTACQIAGLDFTTFNDWRQKDPEFAMKIEKAEGEAIERNMALIQQAAQKDWKASAWLLERRHPEMFARPEVQLANRTSGQGSENLAIWLQQTVNNAPAKADPDTIDISNLELICDCE